MRRYYDEQVGDKWSKLKGGNLTINVPVVDPASLIGPDDLVPLLKIDVEGEGADSPARSSELCWVYRCVCVCVCLAAERVRHLPRAAALAAGQEVDVLYALEPHLKARRILNLMVELNKRSYDPNIEVRVCVRARQWQDWSAVRAVRRWEWWSGGTACPPLTHGGGAHCSAPHHLAGPLPRVVSRLQSRPGVLAQPRLRDHVRPVLLVTVVGRLAHHLR